VIVRPRPYAVTFWAEIPYEESWAEWNMTDVPHCARPEAFVYEDKSRSYRPSGCKRLPSVQSWSKSEHQVFVPFFVSDEFMTKGVGGRCTATAEADCEAKGGYWEGEEGVECYCSLTDEFFVQNAELMRINFKHGFATALPDNLVANQQSSAQGTNSLAQNQAGETVPMITRFMDARGNLCSIDGRAEHHGLDSFSASVVDWLRCASVSISDLDTPSGSLPALRLSGFAIEFVMLYNNIARRGQVLCDVTVQVERGGQPAHTTTDVDLAVPLGSSISEYSREEQGVRTSYKVKGAMRYFSVVTLINNVVNVLFFLLLPKQIVIFIMIYLLGSTSVIYRHAIRMPFWIFGQIRSAVADMLTAKMAFHGLTGGDFSLQETAPVLTKERCLAHLRHLFAKEMKNKTLEKRHLDRMVYLMFEDTGENLDLSTFVKTASLNNPLAFHELVDILQVRQRTTFLERFLDTTRAAEKELPDSEDFLGVEELHPETGHIGGASAISPRASPRDTEPQRSGWSGSKNKKKKEAREEPAPEPDRQVGEEGVQGLAEALEAKLHVLARQLELAIARRRAADERVALAEFVASQCLERLELAEQRLANAHVKNTEAEARARKCAEWAEVNAQEREQLTSSAQELRERLNAWS